MKIVPNVNFILRENGKYIKKNSEFFSKIKKLFFLLCSVLLHPHVLIIIYQVMNKDMMRFYNME